MTDSALNAEQIVKAAQDVLRRFGPAKATVVDVARALGVSHGSVYRHFPSKAALREAVTQRWLDDAHAPLMTVVETPGPAPARLHNWLATLFAAKRAKTLSDPELFATYMVLVGEASEVIARHVDDLVGQITEIVSEGMAQGEFAPGDPSAVARAVFHATTRFHDPAHAGEWSDPKIQDDFDGVWSLILSGLQPRDPAPR
jgi:AcrR family transcriptional regulator